jgi:hypothetical protein
MNPPEKCVISKSRYLRVDPALVMDANIIISDRLSGSSSLKPSINVYSEGSITGNVMLTTI